jgi:hypothetical protein
MGGNPDRRITKGKENQRGVEPEGLRRIWEDNQIGG